MNQRTISERGLDLRDLRGADETRTVDAHRFVQFDGENGLQSLQIGELARSFGKKFHALHDGPVTGIGQIFTPVGLTPTIIQVGDTVLWEDTIYPPWQIPDFPFPSVVLPPYVTPTPLPYAPSDITGGTGFPGGGAWSPTHKSSEQIFPIGQFIDGNTEITNVTTSNGKTLTVPGREAPDLLSPPAIEEDWQVSAATFLYSNYLLSSYEYLLAIKFDGTDSTWRQEASGTIHKSGFALDLSSIIVDHARYFLMIKRRRYKPKQLSFISYYPSWNSAQIEYIIDSEEREIEPNTEGKVDFCELGTPASGNVFARTGTAAREDRFGYAECKFIKRRIRAPR